MARKPRYWTWTRYLATTGPGEATRPDRLLSVFGAIEQIAVASYRRFVAEGIDQPGHWSQLRHQVFLGSEAFVENVRWQMPQDRDLLEGPPAGREDRCAQRRPPATSRCRNNKYNRLHPDQDEAIGGRLR